MKLYKLTDLKGRTRNGVTWTVGETVSIDPSIIGNKLCTNQVLHAYESRLLAEFTNPVHANYFKKRVFEVEGEIVSSDGLKVGCKSLTVVSEIESIEVTTNQQIAFGIFCSLKVYKEKSFVLWAYNWLNGTDRSYASASAAYAAAYASASAAYAAYAAASASASAAYAAASANAASAAASAYANAKIDFKQVAEKAMGY